ncbi:raffinose/stachyose/melibiose transport system permease protein [Kribbella aluminosa]|uniref:Raffinose/stachyose/melibiose transport system permease protein n=1 Tax=Kribbella aluminosa TaxID=416017 RepID=A0ABS4UJ77_9ACTN|nr:carbohydrate ABC transporter permease [Kribbella aluminosa]MBP2351594.1 raffinose/stachyose/melibiose transport system permease protein [Kribbella aluminosa]
MIGSIIALYPFASVLLLSLAPQSERITGFQIPTTLTFANFASAWTQGGFGQALFSSAIVAVGVVLGSLVCSILGGYAFATMRFWGRTVLAGFLLIGLVLPYEGLIVPLYYQLDSMHMLNTYWALILPHIATSSSLGIFWMRSAYENIPASMLDAALIDGASRHVALRRVYLPMSMPAVGTLATLLFLYSWNEFLMPLVFVPQNTQVQTAPLALSFFAGATRNFSASVTAAAAVIVALPVLILYVFLQRRFIAGVASGAVKE